MVNGYREVTMTPSCASCLTIKQKRLEGDCVVSTNCAVLRAILKARLTVRERQERLRPYLGAVFPPGASAPGTKSARTCLFVLSLEAAQAGYKHPLLLNLSESRMSSISSFYVSR